ncbi:MAG: pitrilysin family protein [Pyrinomonadaceae bacterium]
MKSRYFLVALLVLFAASPVSFLGQVPFDAGQYRVKHKKFVLKNGLTLIVHEDKSSPIVGVNVWYHVGSRNEKRGRTGFAHLFEHFFFNGSENHPFGFREAMDDLGANNRNGTTNTDRTNFFEDVPVSALEKTLFLEADRMGFLGGYISQEMLERERGVVKNEKNQGENRPYGRVFSRISEALYPYSHPYSWSTIGSTEDLNAAKLDDIKEWYRTYYGPNNAVLSLAGDISPEKAFELVNKYFGDIPPGPPLPRMARWIPELDRDMRDTIEDRVPQHRVYKVFHAPAWKDADAELLSLFADVLAGSRSSRLNRRLIFEKKLATDVSASMSDRELGGLFLISATVKSGVDPAVVESEIEKVLDETLKGEIGLGELSKFQTRNLAQFLRGSERLGGFGGRSDILAMSQTYGGDPEAYLQKLKTMAGATPASVMDASKRWLKKHSYTLTVIPAAKLGAENVAVDRKTVPGLGAAPDVSFPAVQRAELSNGLKIILLERHSVPIINIALAADAGAASDGVRKAGVADLAMDLIDSGTAKLSAFEIADRLDAVGASLSASNSLDQSVVYLRSTKGGIADSLGIMSDVVLNPSFPEEQFTVKKQAQLASIAQRRATPNSAALELMVELLYGKDHPYGVLSSGKPDTVSSLTREDVVGWHRAWFKPGSSTIIVTGDTTLSEIKPQLEKAFGAWKSGKAPQKSIPDRPSTKGGRIYLIDKPDAPQSAILAAHLSERNGQAEDLAAEPLFRNFGGMSTSRLNRNLRLDKHWSYGTSGVLQPTRGQRPFWVMAPVQTDKTKESMIEVMKEIRDIAGDRPITGEEFESIMRNMSLRLPARFETLSSLESAALQMVNYDLPNDYWSGYANSVRSLTEADLAAAGRKFVKPDDVIWIVVGDIRKIEPGIRELGFGEVVVRSLE